MSTIIKVYGTVAKWDNDKFCWVSREKEIENMLNRSYENANVIPGADPFPAGTAVDIAKKDFKELKVLSMDKEPDYDPKAIY